MDLGHDHAEAAGAHGAQGALHGLAVLIVEVHVQLHHAVARGDVIQLVPKGALSAECRAFLRVEVVRPHHKGHPLPIKEPRAYGRRRRPEPREVGRHGPEEGGVLPGGGQYRVRRERRDDGEVENAGQRDGRRLGGRRHPDGHGSVLRDALLHGPHAVCRAARARIEKERQELRALPAAARASKWTIAELEQDAHQCLQQTRHESVGHYDANLDLRDVPVERHAPGIGSPVIPIDLLPREHAHRVAHRVRVAHMAHLPGGATPGLFRGGGVEHPQLRSIGGAVPARIDLEVPGRALKAIAHDVRHHDGSGGRPLHARERRRQRPHGVVGVRAAVAQRAAEHVLRDHKRWNVGRGGGHNHGRPPWEGEGRAVGPVRRGRHLQHGALEGGPAALHRGPAHDHEDTSEHLGRGRDVQRGGVGEAVEGGAVVEGEDPGEGRPGEARIHGQRHEPVDLDDLGKKEDKHCVLTVAEASEGLLHRDFREHNVVEIIAGVVPSTDSEGDEGLEYGGREDEEHDALPLEEGLAEERPYHFVAWRRGYVVEVLGALVDDCHRMDVGHLEDVGVAKRSYAAYVPEEGVPSRRLAQLILAPQRIDTKRIPYVPVANEDGLHPQVSEALRARDDAAVACGDVVHGHDGRSKGLDILVPRHSERRALGVGEVQAYPQRGGLLPPLARRRPEPHEEDRSEERQRPSPGTRG
mmetsp:Transcript_10324/g.33320  ORF Transcript_10324/g.33320 Transcript_10324/m.33320 type:complete len:696 (-) Transcript_10324:243-2330(-)